MREFIAGSATFGVVLSLVCYYIGVLLKKKFNSGLMNPLLISIILVIIILLTFKIDYADFNSSAKVSGNVTWNIGNDLGKDFTFAGIE